jgi:hypothetical protein
VQIESGDVSEVLTSTGVGIYDRSRACDQSCGYDRCHDIPAL